MLELGLSNIKAVVEIYGNDWLWPVIQYRLSIDLPTLDMILSVFSDGRMHWTNCENYLNNVTESNMTI